MVVVRACMKELCDARNANLTMKIITSTHQLAIFIREACAYACRASLGMYIAQMGRLLYVRTLLACCRCVMYVSCEHLAFVCSEHMLLKFLRVTSAYVHAILVRHVWGCMIISVTVRMCSVRNVDVRL